MEKIIVLLKKLGIELPCFRSSRARASGSGTASSSAASQ